MTDLIPAPVYDVFAADVKRYLDSALARNTIAAYKGDIDRFIGWGGAVPCSPDMLVAYLVTHAPTHAVATLSRWTVSISRAHALCGYPDPAKNEIVKLTLRGIKRQHGRPQRQASPVTKEDMILMLSHAPGNLRGIRDRALLLLGFSCALRRSELCAVQAEDIEFTAQGLVLTIPRSKTDQDSNGQKVGVPFGRSKICPVQAVKDWLAVSGIMAGPVFRAVEKNAVTRQAICDRTVSNIVKAYAKRAGLDSEKFSSHSLRAGLATSAAEHGYSSWEIRRQTRHASDATLQRYIRLGSLFQRNAASLF